MSGNGERPTLPTDDAPVVAVVSASERLRRAVADACAERVAAAGDWSALGADDRAHARVCIYACERLDERAIAGVRDVERRAGYLPIVLVTGGSRDNARALKDVSVREVVWLDRIAADLSPVLDGVKSDHRLADRFARTILAHPGCTDEHFRQAILRVCTSDASAPTAQAFARLALCSPTGVRDRLRPLLGSKRRATSFFLDCCLLLRACDLAHAGKGRATVAVVLDIDDRTLDRVSLRISGATFARLRMWPPSAVLERVLEACGSAPNGATTSAATEGVLLSEPA